MLKKFAIIFFSFWLAFWLITPVQAVKNKVTIHFFWSSGCPHCGKERIFLQNLVQKYPEVELKDYGAMVSQENVALFTKVSQKFGTGGYVPLTVIGEEFFLGYLDDENTGARIEKAVKCALENGCQDAVGSLMAPPKEDFPKEREKVVPETLKLPLLGRIQIKNLSLPVLTFVIALLDGFNPCAMWTLLFLISLLLGMKNRKRMWILGTVFIGASAFVYFLFLSAWLNLFLFLGFVLWVRVLVGLIALVAGGYNLRDYWINREGGCKAMGDEKRQRIFEKFRAVTQKKEFLLALGGMILLAFLVNLIELVCSVGLPAIYTQILSLTSLPKWQYYLYLIFYILVFMADDLFVFFVAMTTLHAVGIQSKYARYSRLIGGSLMLLIGILMLFKPEWLMFG